MADERPLDYATPAPPRRSMLWVIGAIVFAALLLLMMVFLFVGRARVVPAPPVVTPAPTVTSPSGGG
jgi:hypothetical protein